MKNMLPQAQLRLRFGLLEKLRTRFAAGFSGAIMAVLSVSLCFMVSETLAQGLVPNESKITRLWNNEKKDFAPIGCHQHTVSSSPLAVLESASATAKSKYRLVQIIAANQNKTTVNDVASSQGEREISVANSSLHNIKDFQLVATLPTGSTIIARPVFDGNQYSFLSCTQSVDAGDYMLFLLKSTDGSFKTVELGLRAKDFDYFKNYQVTLVDEDNANSEEEEALAKRSHDFYLKNKPGVEDALDSGGNQGANSQSKLRNYFINSYVAPKRYQAPVAPTAAATKALPSAPPQTVKSQTNHQASPSAAVSASSSGSIEYVVCTSSARLNVRDESLSRIIFQANQYEVVKPYQGWNTDSWRKKINGKNYNFIKVEFPGRTSGVRLGWVADYFVKMRGSCSGAPTKSISTAPATGGASKSYSALFPTATRPFQSYLTDGRSFGASRSNGRRHAGVDLIQSQGEPVKAIQNGVVIKDPYAFYNGTWAVEIRFENGSVGRFGEVQNNFPSNIRMGQKVQAGQLIGYVGKALSRPMLHFEMYSGSSSGNLTNRGSFPYMRRSDLANPTEIVRTLERITFGKSY